MAVVALAELGFHEFICRALHHFVVEALFEIVEERTVAIDEARFEKRRADGEILARQTNAIGGRARGMTDLETEIPEHIEHVFDDALAPRRLLVGQQEKQIDIRTRRQLAPAIAAHRGDGDAFSLARIGRRENIRGGEGVEFANDRILQIAEAFGANAAFVGALLQPFARLGAARGQRRLQHLDDTAPPIEFVLAATAKNGGQITPDRVRIGDFEQTWQAAAHEGATP